MKSAPGLAWISRLHDDGTSLDGWFIAGMCLPTGDVTYHMFNGFWALAQSTGAKVLDRAPKWDGHTSVDVEKRLQEWFYQPSDRHTDTVVSLDFARQLELELNQWKQVADELADELSFYHRAGSKALNEYNKLKK